MSSRFAGATVFRDANRNGALDARERRATTDPDGSFVPPRGAGRLFLQGGVDLDTGLPNNLLLTTPSGTRGIGVLTSLFQAIAERSPRRPRTVRSVLGLGARVGLRAITFVAAQGNADTPAVLQRDAQQTLLARLFKSLTLGAAATGATAAQSAVALTPRASAPRRRRGDATLGALADALLALDSAPRTPVDLADPATVQSVFEFAVDSLGIAPLDTSQMATAVQAVAQINFAFAQGNPADASFAKLRQIADNAVIVTVAAVAANDFTVLDEQFTDGGLQTQITGDVFVPAQPLASTEWVSIAASGEPADAGSASPAVSQDGRFVAFESAATNLVLGPIGAREVGSSRHVFLRDTAERATQLVSQALAGTATPPNGDSQSPAINADGRFVAFASRATNLVREPVVPAPVGSSQPTAVYVRDVPRGRTAAVSLDRERRVAEGANPSLSADGTLVAFDSGTALATADTNGVRDVYVRDTGKRTTVRVSLADDESEPNGDSFAPSISADGNIVVFVSTATNLSLFDENQTSDVYLRDRRSQTTTLISRNSDNLPANGTSTDARVSGNGRFVAFVSTADDLIPGTNPNRLMQIYRFDTQASLIADRLSLVSTALLNNVGGADSRHPSISLDGQRVAFDSSADNLVALPDENFFNSVFVRDLRTPFANLASRGLGGTFGMLPNAASQTPALSADGQRVAFASDASNLATGDSANPSSADIFVAPVITDLADTSSTTGRIAVGGSVIGTIDFPGDRDWFAVTLEAGSTYQITLQGAGDQQGTLADPSLIGVFSVDAEGIASAVPGTSDDNSGGNGGARLEFTPTSSGLYFLSAGAADEGLGTYRLALAVPKRNALSFTSLGEGIDLRQGSYSLGWRFTANRDLTVTELGFYDDLGNGIGGPRPVGIYAVDSCRLLATTAVQPSDPLDGFFRYRPIAPVVLPGQRDYYIAALNATDRYAVFVSRLTVDPSITFRGFVIFGNTEETSSLRCPNGSSAPNVNGDFGPGFRFE